jgi:ATP-dependent exoDNAse (exonuclease V) beta subunit
LPTGQVLNGRIDLLLETEGGWVLIDHKSNPGAAEHWEQLAIDYGAQLSAYAHALHQASGRQVAEAWLFLPVAAGLIRCDPRPIQL